MTIHSVTSLTIDKTVFNNDLRTYSNRSLKSSVISNFIYRILFCIVHNIDKCFIIFKYHCLIIKKIQMN